MSHCLGRTRCARKATAFLWIGAYLLAALINGCGAETAFAQDGSVPFTATESVAIDALGKQLQEINAERQQLITKLQAVEADIAKEHPGYHFDETKVAIVKDAPKPAAAPKPAKR